MCMHMPWGERHRPHQTKCRGSSGYHCRFSPRRLEKNAERAPDTTHMYVPENCARPRARAHLVMCPWVSAQIPSEHPRATASTHKMRLRDNTGETLSPTGKTDAPETATPTRQAHNYNTKSCSARHRRAEAARAATRASHVCEKAATRKTKPCAKRQRVRQRAAPSGNA